MNGVLRGGFRKLILVLMPRRRKLLLLAALAVVPILVGVGFVYRYDLTGWIRGEASYRGKYTCFRPPAVYGENLQTGAQITTNLCNAGGQGHLLVEIAAPDGQQFGLLHDSLISCINLATVDPSRIHKVIAFGEWSGHPHFVSGGNEHASHCDDRLTPL